jgi:hypothetical protein
MQKSLFREEAMDKVLSPDELDRLMRVTDPKGWLALIALLAYPGYVEENAEGIPWPGALRRASQLLCGRSLSMFIRSLHYVKIVYQPGEGLEAKAYLAGNHHWHTPACQNQRP